MNSQQRLILILFILILIAMTISISFGFIMSYYYPYSCDIGKPEVVGDYEETGWGSQSFGFIGNSQCAIKDCIAFNELNGETRCVV